MTAAAKQSLAKQAALCAAQAAATQRFSPYGEPKGGMDYAKGLGKGVQMSNHVAFQQGKFGKVKGGNAVPFAQQLELPPWKATQQLMGTLSGRAAAMEHYNDVLLTGPHQ